MLRIGITGGIGCGKTYVCRRLETMGYPVYDCDTAAKRLMVEDAKLVQGVKRLIGDDAYLGRELNKAVVAQYLFQSERHATRLNALVHPAVRQDFMQWTERQTSPYVFVESAILFQAKMDTLCDRIWCVTAPLELRLSRVMQRDHVDEQAVRHRILRQMDDSEVQRRSNDLILNDGTHDIDAQLIKLIESLTIKS